MKPSHRLAASRRDACRDHLLALGSEAVRLCFGSYVAPEALVNPALPSADPLSLAGEMIEYGMALADFTLKTRIGALKRVERSLRASVEDVDP